MGGRRSQADWDPGESSPIHSAVPCSLPPPSSLLPFPPDSNPTAVFAFCAISRLANVAPCSRTTHSQHFRPFMGAQQHPHLHKPSPFYSHRDASSGREGTSTFEGPRGNKKRARLFVWPRSRVSRPSIVICHSIICCSSHSAGPFPLPFPPHTHIPIPTTIAPITESPAAQMQKQILLRRSASANGQMPHSASFICHRYMLSDAELSATFDMLDMDKDGRLSRGDIAALLRAGHTDPTRKELDFLFQEMDRQKEGKINKESFVSYLRCPPINRITIKELRSTFAKFDCNRDGTINREDLKQILAQTADLHDEEAIDAMFEQCDRDEDGRITFDEFVHLMREGSNNNEE